ncbi:hypothetical protein SCNU_18587 [Gordonia neofelifaecis NRRL B-59395]|uniref:Alpha/beta hydrolase n=2 Tax=Gordonia TaxID=2053 RepID=F1YP55_9ACTN|nr:hypothetical protein SCNU_18587 [Gordonia neofelifaecis NRRL B-59395]
MVAEPTYVIVPGLRGHVEEHWQTLLAATLEKSVIIPPIDTIDLDTRVAALEAAVAGVDGPVILVAHSAGVPTTVYWASRTELSVAGALLATPPDLDKPLGAGHPTREELDAAGWGPLPMSELPMPTIVAASTDDPLAGLDKTTELAQAWGSRLVNLGEVGHLNPASGYGPWPAGAELLAELREMIGVAA